MAKILVAEDEHPIARIIQVNLNRAGYETFIVRDGIEAVVKTVSERPDIVILDISLPRMDGHEILQYLRTDEDTRKIPVIALLPKGETAVQKPVGGGLTVWLNKPFNPMELISRVKRILREKGEETGFPHWVLYT